MGWLRSGERRGTVVLLAIVGLIVAAMAIWRAGSGDEESGRIEVKVEETDPCAGVMDSLDRAVKSGRTDSRKKKRGKAVEKKHREDVVMRDYLDERIDGF